MVFEAISPARCSTLSTRSASQLGTQPHRHHRHGTYLPYLHIAILSVYLLCISCYCRCLQTKAKAIRKYVDKMIGLAKEGTLHARRQALGFVYDPELVKSLFEQVGEAAQGVGCRV
jgi:hypothetical protein